jgi:hypothetical protein
MVQCAWLRPDGVQWFEEGLARLDQSGALQEASQCGCLRQIGTVAVSVR